MEWLKPHTSDNDDDPFGGKKQATILYDNTNTNGLFQDAPAKVHETSLFAPIPKK